MSEHEQVRVLIEKLGIEVTVRQVGGGRPGAVESQSDEETERMELVARFAGGVAHELNNLLTAIGGFNELMLTRMSESNPLRRDAEEIERAVQRAGALTRRLLAIARRQVLNPVVLDPNTLLADLETRLRELVGEGVELKLALDARTPRVKASPEQLQEIILLLVESAVGEIGGAGTVLVESSLSADGASARLAVTDSGGSPGEADRVRIFEPFFAEDRRRRGGGLLLAAVYGMVAQNGGTLTIASPEAGRTTVAVELPAVNDPISQTPTRATILLAEDEDAVRAMIRETLDRRGYEVLEARDGTEALELAQRFVGPINLVVTDVAMPGLSGLELVRALRQTRPELRVLYMSGSPGEAVARDLEVRAGTGFLGKPVMPAGLALRVRQMLDEPIEAEAILAPDQPPESR